VCSAISIYLSLLTECEWTATADSIAGTQNSQDCVRHVQAHDICIRFVTAGVCSVQAMDLTLRRTLGPRVPVSSVETLRRLLAYLGALPEALNEFDKCRESLGKGNVRITLQPGRRNLLHPRMTPGRGCQPATPSVLSVGASTLHLAWRCNRKFTRLNTSIFPPPESPAVWQLAR
jgi:hypothetical protein